MSSDRINRHRNGHFSRETSIDGHKKIINYKLEDFDMVKTIGTGTFARVCLCRDQTSRDYFALKILAIHDVIRLKQVEHVKNEKNILKVRSTDVFLRTSVQGYKKKGSQNLRF
eukprot:GFUD01053461.1.p1 GENE.GFUD01053461.1~~GFUD01053461.1.p1  ORF type:complete len:125 (+),score=17.26 GFUD01053461.1:37-375(+)